MLQTHHELFSNIWVQWDAQVAQLEEHVPHVQRLTAADQGSILWIKPWKGQKIHSKKSEEARTHGFPAEHCIATRSLTIFIFNVVGDNYIYCPVCSDTKTRNSLLNVMVPVHWFHVGQYSLLFNWKYPYLCHKYNWGITAKKLFLYSVFRIYTV